MKYQTISLKQFYPAKGAIYYVAIATVTLSHVKITCYFHVWRYHVFAQKLTWYFIGVYMIIGDILVFNILHDRAIFCLASSAQGSHIHFPTSKGKKSERRGRGGKGKKSEWTVSLLYPQTTLKFCLLLLSYLVVIQQQRQKLIYRFS